MLTREQFVALLARLRGEGEALTAAELAQMAAYAAHHNGVDVEAREAITDEELEEVEAGLMALGASDDLPLDALEAAVEAVEAVRTVGEERDAADAAAAAEAARLEAEAAQRRQELQERLAGPQASDAGGADGDGEDANAGDGDGGEDDGAGADAGEGGDDAGEGGDGDDAGTGDGEGAENADDAREPVGAGATAAAGGRPARRAPGTLRGRRTAGEPAARQARRGNRILRDASRGGGEFADLAELGQAMYETRSRFLHANEGVSEMMVLGSIEAEYAEDHVLDPRRADEQLSALTAAAEAGMNGDQYDAVTAAGGFCAPVEPYYGIMALATAGRPFRSSFPQRNAGRGRILYRTPPDFPDFAGAVSQWTETNDANPGADGPATKPCLVVPCPDDQEAEIYAVTECLTFGNFMARTDPETIANAVTNTAAAFARKAETLMIDAVKAASTAVTAGDALGAYRDLSYQIRVAAAGFRSRHRMAPDAVLEVRLPAWTYDVVLADLVRSLPGDGTLAAGRDLFDRALAAANVRLAGTYIDSPTSGIPQVFGPQNATQLVDFPAAIQWHITAPGSFVVLDNGRLDLGVVRDSILNRTNDYQTFAEIFEGIAFLGLESNWITSTVCPNGASSGTVDPSAFCSGDYVPA